MSKKSRFFGKYYKFISDDGYTFALICSIASEGEMIQLITPTGSYLIKDTRSVTFKNDEHHIDIDINQDDISLKGCLELGEYHRLSKPVMGPFRHFKMQCVHEIYSMYHTVNGELTLNKDKTLKFTDALGYIEGDSGSSFPKKYIWYNSILDDVSVTLAIATIPLLGFIRFTGLLCFIKSKDFEYRFVTYNHSKIKKKDNNQIIIKKGKYRFILDIPFIEGHELKAPIKGNMSRYIKENINVPTHYELIYKDKIILAKDDKISSLEYMY